MAATEWHPLVNTIIRVTRRTLLRPATAWADSIQGHWGIENRNHYVHDVSCDEDKSRIRDNPGIMARARSFALNILRKNGITNVASTLWSCPLSLDYILTYKAIRLALNSPAELPHLLTTEREISGTGSHPHF